MVNNNFSTDNKLPLGYPKRALLVYQSALKKKESSAHELAEEAGLPRTSVYNILGFLVKEGLVMKTKLSSGKAVFQALPPKTLLNKAKESKKKALEMEKEVRTLVQNLEQIVGAGPDEAIVKVYRGLDGAWAIIEDVLYAKNDSYWFTATHLPFRKLVSEKEYFRRITHRRKRMKATKSYVIADRSEFALKLQRQAEADFREVKILPPDIKLSGTLIIYGSKIALVVYSKILRGVTIENRLAANLLRVFYDLVWQSVG